jgi:predicted outer membrane repeat protein
MRHSCPPNTRRLRSGFMAHTLRTLVRFSARIKRTAEIHPGAVIKRTLTINDSTFSGHTSDNDTAILNESTLTVKPSEFVSNTAGISGGAIFSLGTLTVSNSAFSDNETIASVGAGIYTSGTATVANGTFSGGVAGTGGGRIASGGTLSSAAACSPRT